MSTLPGLRVNYARVLMHCMTFTLKQREVLKKILPPISEQTVTDRVSAIYLRELC